MGLPEHYFPMACSGGDVAYAEKHSLFEDEDYVAQTKLDGARYLLHVSEDGIARMYSRQISKVTGKPVDKSLQLKHIIEDVIGSLPAGTVLDGEVCAPGLSSSNLVTRVSGSKPDRALAVQQESGFLQFKVFDCLAYDGQDVTGRPLSKRFDYLFKIFNGAEFKYVEQVDTIHGMKRELYDSLVASGHEGIILKHLYSPYEQGVRAKHQVKVKKQKSYDVIFIGIEQAEEFTVKKGHTEATRSRIAGKAGAIRFGQYVQTHLVGKDSLFSEPTWELKELGTVSGFDDETRDDITKNADKYQGRALEVLGQEQFSSGSIRHPRFLRWRDDKDASECRFRKDEG